MGRGPTEKYYKDMMGGYVRGTLTCLAQETIINEINTDFPLVLNIEPTSRCNMKCYLCARHLTPKAHGDMEFEMYKKIIDEAAEHKQLRMLNFHKDGESLLHPRIYEMIRYARDKDVSRVLHINTNALCLTGENVDRFLKSGITDVTISLDAARPETFLKIKQVPGYEKVETNVRQLFKRKQELGLKTPFIRVKIMEFADVTREEIDEFFAKWENIADEVQVTGVHSWSGAIEELQVTDEQKEQRFPCILMWYMMAVNWDGRVSVCNVDWNLSGVVGDCNTNTIHEIWNSKAMKKARKEDLKANYRHINACEKCIVWASGTDLTEFFKTKKAFYI